MKLNFEWKDKKEQYANGRRLFVNRINVASYDWGITHDAKWDGMVHLPSLKNDTLHFDDNNEMEKQIELKVTAWFEEALKGSKEN